MYFWSHLRCHDNAWFGNFCFQADLIFVVLQRVTFSSVDCFANIIIRRPRINGCLKFGSLLYICVFFSTLPENANILFLTHYITFSFVKLLCICLRVIKLPCGFQIKIFWNFRGNGKHMQVKKTKCTPTNEFCLNITLINCYLHLRFLFIETATI